MLEVFCGHALFVWNKVLAWNLERLARGEGIVRYGEADFYCENTDVNAAKKGIGLSVKQEPEVAATRLLPVSA